MTESVLDVPLIQFVGVVLELLLYGIYVVLFAATAWALHMRRHGAKAHSVSPIIDICSWFVFITLTIHCAGTTWFAYYGYIVLATNPLSQLIYLSDQGSQAALLRGAMYGLSVLGMEVMLIYRLWIVWSRSWLVIIVPCALLALDFVGFVISLHGLDHTASPGLIRATAVWIEPAIFFCEAFTNILCGGLIAFRITRDSLSVSSVGLGFGRGIRPVLWIIAESACVYSALTLVIAVGLVTKEVVCFALMDIIPPFAGISSCLLLVRVGLELAEKTVSPRGSSRERDESFGFRVQESGRHGGRDSMALRVSAARRGLPLGKDVEAGSAPVFREDTVDLALQAPHEPWEGPVLTHACIGNGDSREVAKVDWALHTGCDMPMFTHDFVRGVR